MLEQSISRVLFPISVTLYGTMIIHLAPILLLGSSNLPWGSDGQPSNAPLFGLALGGVCHASNVTIGAVSSYLAFSPLPDRMDQPSNQAVYFLWHFPSRHRDWVLPSTLPCRARTFLHSMRRTEQRPFVLLQHRLPFIFSCRLLRILFLLPIDDPVAIGAAFQRTSPYEVVVLLGRYAQVTALADSIYYGNYHLIS
jgi:hypothetical protein